MQITTDRLTLRPLAPEDASWLAREIANPKVQMWLTSPPHPYRLQDAQAFIDRCAADPFYRVIEADGQGAGVVSIKPGEDLGYWLAEHAWGRGYMTEAASALLAACFTVDTSDVPSGWIAGNARSRQVLQKLGFVADGTKRRTCFFRGEEVTIECVVLTRARWQALSAARE